METIITKLNLLADPCSQVILTDESGVNLNEAIDIISKIKEVMGSDKTILALSAPQIGIKKRVLCIRFKDAIKAFVNPIITKKADFKISHETCASMPGKEIVVVRPEDITVVYYNDKIKYEENKILGLAARLFDQQLQFFDGVTPADLGLVSDVKDDGSLTNATEEELKEIYDFYKNFIAIKTDAVKKNIEANSELAPQYKTMKFTEDVITGRTQVITDDAKCKLNREQRRAVEKQTKKMKSKKGKK